MLIYVRAIRTSDFHLCVDALSNIVPWFFSLNHTHNARWIPVHILYMVSLHANHPDVYEHFLKGEFTVLKTGRAIAIDRAHEQNNAAVKGDGDAVGLTENSAALQRWMVSGPEMDRVIEHLVMPEKTLTYNTMSKTKTHKPFLRDIKSLILTMEDMGNPFCENSSDLLVLDTRDVADKTFADGMYTIENIGQKQYDAYVCERLIDQVRPISDPINMIKRNNIPLFTTTPRRVKSISQQQVLSLKGDYSFFSRFYVASQIRNGDLDDFFNMKINHIPQLCPRWVLWELVLTALVDCLEDIAAAYPSVNTPAVQTVIIDSARAVSMLKPGPATKTFFDFANQHFLPDIKSHLHSWYIFFR